MYKLIKGYGFSFISLIILIMIYDYLQETYLTLKVKNLPLAIALSVSALVFSYIGYKNIRGHKYQKFLGLVQAIFIFVTLQAVVYLLQLRSLTIYDKYLTIVIFIILTVTLIISLRNIFYEKKRKIIPLDYMGEA